MTAVGFWYSFGITLGEKSRKVGRRIPRNRHDRLNCFWPSNAPYTPMLSTNCTITTWGAVQGKATPEIMQTICTDSIYVTTDSIRRIYKMSRPRYRWVKDILELSPPEH